MKQTNDDPDARITDIPEPATGNDGPGAEDDASPALPVGTLVDQRYEICREIARGGMSIVYCASHKFTGRTVALKLPHPETDQLPGVYARLLREAKALALSRSPYVPDVLDAGLLDDGSPFLAMELVEGRTLAGVLSARSTLSVSETISLGLQLCRALGQAHDRNIVHRDVKPANVVLVPSSTQGQCARLIDFGIAAILNPASAPLLLGVQARHDRITRPGEFFGTPEYIAPEIIQLPDAPDPRSDIYSLGITLFECLSGTVPFKGTFAEVFLQTHLAGRTPDIREHRPEVPERLSVVLARAMACDPADRFSHPRQMAKALAECLLESRATTASDQRARAESAGQTSPAQRRRYSRAPYVTSVSISVEQGMTLSGRSEDISEGGLLVVASGACPDQARVTVRFTAPLTNQITYAQATARWVKSGRIKTALGLEFTSIPDSVRRGIALYTSRAAQ